MTEYILFLDDDLCFPSDTVEKMRDFLVRENADIIAPDIFPNAHRSILSQILMTFSGRMYARHKKNDCWGYKVLRNSGYSYNSKPIRDTYRSQTNAGACFLCSKQKFLDIHFEEELWMDEVEYSLGDDQVMYYKMYLMGLKQLTWYTHHFIHLDAGQNMCPLKKKKIIYSDFRFKVIFWHRFIFKPEQFLLFRLLDIFCISYFFMLSLMISIFKGELDIFKVKLKALLNGINYLRSSQYHSLPIVRKNLT